MLKSLRFLLISLMLVAFLPDLQAQTFVGSQTCINCHNNVNANTGYNIVSEYTKSGHPYKLNEVNGGPPMYPANTSPGVNNAPPAAPDWSNYSFVIGGYGWKARFIQASDGHVFTSDSSAQWNFQTQAWVPYNFGQATPYNYNCFKCHTTGPDPAGSWHPTTPDLGTFTEPGIRCEGCHGPGSAHIVNPINVSPPIVGDSLAYFRCGDCHQRGGKSNLIPGNGYIQHHEQFNEMRASRHGDQVGSDLTCTTCHDAHIPLVYPQAAGAGLTAIRMDCADCHANYDILVNGQVKQIDCVDCHMPKAGRSAVGTQVGNGFVGDVSTHIMAINTDAVTRDAMFEGGFVKLDSEGLAKVTLDFACLQCHQSKDVTWAAQFADDIHTNGIITSIETFTEIPRSFDLLQNYPNPFNPTTTIAFELPKSARVILSVYDVLGQHVQELTKGVRPPGRHEITFDASNLPSGVYIYRLETEKGVFSKKMVLMK